MTKAKGVGTGQGQPGKWSGQKEAIKARLQSANGDIKSPDIAKMLGIKLDGEKDIKGFGVYVSGIRKGLFGPKAAKAKAKKAVNAPSPFEQFALAKTLVGLAGDNVQHAIDFATRLNAVVAVKALETYQELVKELGDETAAKAIETMQRLAK